MRGGRSPGSRFVAGHGLPGLSTSGTRCIRLAAHSCGGSRGFRKIRFRVPSFALLREEGPSRTAICGLLRAKVNRTCPGRHSLRPLFAAFSGLGDPIGLQPSVSLCQMSTYRFRIDDALHTVLQGMRMRRVRPTERRVILYTPLNRLI